MIGLCPHCKIILDKPPFNKRDTNEVILTLKYRKIVENNIFLKNFEDIGYCELCHATKRDKYDQENEI